MLFSNTMVGLPGGCAVRTVSSNTRYLVDHACLSGRDVLIARAPDSSSKGCEFESRQERREKFLLQS